LDDRRNPSVGPNEAFQQGLIRFDGTLEAHQVDIYLSRNANVGFALPCRQNCGRGGPVMTRGVGPQRPSVGRLGIEVSSPTVQQQEIRRLVCHHHLFKQRVRVILSLMVGRNLLFMALYRTASVRGRRRTLFRPFHPFAPCFPELRRKKIPYCVKRHDSSSSLLELDSWKGVIFNDDVDFGAWSSPAARYMSGANDGFRCGRPHHFQKSFGTCPSWRTQMYESSAAGDGTL
jgi:hypothetical protein